MSVVQFDSIKPEEYEPSLYKPDASITPIDGFAAFDDGMMDQYQALGFVSVANAFTPDEVRAAILAMQEIVAGEPPEGTQVQYEFEAQDKLDSVSQRGPHLA